MHQMFAQRENAVLQGMARSDHILQCVADMKIQIISEEQRTMCKAIKGKAEQLIKQGSDLIMKQAIDLCTQNLEQLQPLIGGMGDNTFWHAKLEDVCFCKDVWIWDYVFHIH